MNAPGGCSWRATSLVPWVTITGGGSGAGDGTISFNVAQNSGPTRTGQILHTDDSFYTVAQASGCAYSLNRTSEAAPPGGGDVVVNVTASDAACGWTASANASFIGVKAGAGGIGNGTVTLSVSPNASGVARTGTATIAGQTFTVTQPELEPQVSTLSFNQSSYSFSEGQGRATLVVRRSGDLSGTATVEYRTVDDPSAVPCATLDTKAYARCDYATTVDVVVFAPQEEFKEINIPLIDDAYVENEDETVEVVLSNPSAGARPGIFPQTTLTINDNDVAGRANPILQTPFFVRQHYLDFLSREPEAGEPWSGVLNRCADVNTDPTCDRILVSGRVGVSPEFRLKGFFVYNFYKVGFNRLPNYEEIIPDMRSVSGTTAAELYAKRAAFPVAFTQRAAFKGLYDALTNPQYVEALMRRYGLPQITTPDPANPEGGAKITMTRDDLINRLSATGVQTLTRAQVLRAIVESDEVGTQEYNRAFVAMQYYGYLRRTPEQDGYNAWLRVINQDSQNIRVMLNGFLNSAEYRLRFGAP